MVTAKKPFYWDFFINNRMRILEYCQLKNLAENVRHFQLLSVFVKQPEKAMKAQKLGESRISRIGRLRNEKANFRLWNKIFFFFN